MLMRTAVVSVLLLLAGCGGGDAPPPTPAARRAHKMAIASAAKDRMVLQYLVKDAEAVNLRVPSLRRVSDGFVIGDTSVIWFAFFSGDSLLVLDETRRAPSDVEENARYLFRGDTLHYVALDRIQTFGTRTPIRTRLAFGFDTSGALSATSKNINDAAAPLDTLADVMRVADRARALRERVLSRNTTP